MSADKKRQHLQQIHHAQDIAELLMETYVLCLKTYSGTIVSYANTLLQHFPCEYSTNNTPCIDEITKSTKIMWLKRQHIDFKVIWQQLKKRCKFRTTELFVSQNGFRSRSKSLILPITRTMQVPMHHSISRLMVRYNIPPQWSQSPALNGEQYNKATKMSAIHLFISSLKRLDGRMSNTAMISSCSYRLSSICKQQIMTVALMSTLVAWTRQKKTSWLNVLMGGMTAVYWGRSSK